MSFTTRLVLSAIMLMLSNALFSGIHYSDTLKLSRHEGEARFLEHNLLLLAGQLDISRADALVSQARLWPNPTLTIDEVNLWATDQQSMGEELPPLFGDFGKNQQLSIQIEQLIITAGKRRKLIALEEVSAGMAREYFEELLRNLKIEFRQNLTELHYLQMFSDVFEQQLTSVQSLLEAYSRQLRRGNITQGEYIRLKALELELRKELNEITMSANEVRKELSLLLNIPPETFIIISQEGFVPDPGILDQLNLPDLQVLAVENRPDMKLARLNETHYQKLYRFERAQRVPDLTFIGGYDRGGNFLLDFIGVGISMDIPVFNRNQGNIRHAELGMEQSSILAGETSRRIAAEVALTWQNIMAGSELFESIDQNFEAELDSLLESYAQNFIERNISLLEYIDFLEAYLANKKIILNTQKELNHAFEELQYMIGKDFD